MAVHVVTELLKALKSKYQGVLDDAVEFYKVYDQLYGLYAKQTNKVEEIEQQINTIESYKTKHGIYPQIKGQPNAEAYLDELAKLKARAEQDIYKTEPEVLKGFEKRGTMIRDIANKIARATLTERDVSQFLGTMMLRAPTDTDHNRCATNEKNKPIFISALMISLIRNLDKLQILDQPFISERMPVLVPDEQHPDMLTFDEASLKRYIEQVLTPIITAALIHNIGSYSVEAEEIFSGNRFRPLEEDERKKLIKFIYDHSLNYLHYGLGAPRKIDYPDAKDYEQAMESFKLTETILKNFTSAKHPLGNILRIPMIYSSFMMSTKPSHDYRLLYKAYDILQSGITKEVIYPKFGGIFLDMVGQYPVGTGVVFISKETNYPERAVVSRINPSQPTSCIVKQLTRRQTTFDDHTQVEVSEGYMVNNEEARANSEFNASYFKKQFPEGYFWCPIEVWERDIDHNRFWRRDNNIKSN